jgi:hypothetical protein
MMLKSRSVSATPMLSAAEDFNRASVPDIVGVLQTAVEGNTSRTCSPALCLNTMQWFELPYISRRILILDAVFGRNGIHR